MTRLSVQVAGFSGYELDDVYSHGTLIVHAALRDETPVRVEAWPTNEKERGALGNTRGGAPNWIACAGLGNETPFASAGETAEEAVGNVLDRLNQRYVA